MGVLPSKSLTAPAAAPWPIPEQCAAAPDAVFVAAFAIPHAVVPQVLRPDVAAFLAPNSVLLQALPHAQCCVTALTFDGIGSHGPWVIRDMVQFAKSLPHLTQLTVHGSDTISDDYFEAISELTELRFLELRGWTADADNFAHLRKFTQLRTFVCRCTKVDAACLAHVGALSQLRYLDVANCWRVDAAAVRHLTGLRELRTLVAFDCFSIDAECLLHLGTISTLRYLDVRHCGLVNDASVDRLRASLPELRVLRTREDDDDGFGDPHA